MLMKKEIGEVLKPFLLFDKEEIEKVKEKIERPLISLTDIGLSCIGKELTNVIHIDINSAFPAGVVESYPQTKEFFQHHFDNRKLHPESKAIMNFSIGAAQSLKLRYLGVYPELARAGIA